MPISRFYREGVQISGIWLSGDVFLSCFVKIRVVNLVSCEKCVRF